MTAVWEAPFAAAPVDASVRLPGSKSLTNRWLVLAALARGRSHVHGALRSRDTELMAAGLRGLGVTVDAAADDWTVDAAGTPLRPTATTVDVGNAGTVMRFLTALATLADGSVHLDGDARIRERPVGALVDALRELGARIDDDGRAALPLTVHGRGALTGGRVTIDASASSQLVTALLLTAPAMRDGLTVRHAGAPLPSQPHLAMTVACLRRVGVDVDDSARDSWHVHAGPVRRFDATVEPDLSTAAPFLAAAAVTGGQVRVPGWPATTTQPGAVLPDLLAAMGASYDVEPDGLVLRGSGLHGLDVDLRDVSELAPVLAAVAAVADSPSRLTGLAHTRRHETDRLAALGRELSAVGAEVVELDDGLEIRPRPLRATVWSTYDDHRLAMAGAVLGLVVAGLRLDDVATTGKTMPGFATAWTQMLAQTGARA